MTCPSIPSALAYNDEPSLRACFEPVPGWGVELVMVDFPVPTEWVDFYRCGIRNLDGHGVRSALQSANSKVEVVRRRSDSHA